MHALLPVCLQFLQVFRFHRSDYLHLYVVLNGIGLRKVDPRTFIKLLFLIHDVDSDGIFVQLFLPWKLRRRCLTTVYYSVLLLIKTLFKCRLATMGRDPTAIA